MSDGYQYDKIFDPSSSATAPVRAQRRRAGDRRDGEVYLYTDELILAINVALASARPLLVRGPSGTGKSSMAQHIARLLGWRYYEEVISSSTQARDLLWTFDALARLSDSQRGRQYPSLRYIKPGPLWWAFERGTARTRGAEPGTEDVPPAIDKAEGVESDAAVVLLDEIDKADPDVPNNLLVPIGSLQFTLREGEVEREIHAVATPLVVITTNEERELPAAFLRRCVVTTLERPDAGRLVAIASAHFGTEDTALYSQIAAVVEQLAVEKRAAGEPPPSTAEFLDAVSVCRNLKVDAGSTVWESVARTVLVKSRRDDAVSAGNA